MMHRLLLAALILPSCGQVCGPGTVAVDKQCVPEQTDDSQPTNDDSPADDSPADDSPADDTGEEPGLVEATDPGMPAFPSTIGTLSVALRTNTGTFDGTNSNQLSICLSADDCVRLNIADVDDFRVGELDQYQFEGFDMPRSQVDRVEIRSANGTDRWSPSCLQLNFDGEPVYCSELEDLYFGEESDELQSWSDSDGLHLDCSSCWTDPLTHGPMLGESEPDGARVWVRADATRPVGLRMSPTPDLSEGVVVDWAYPSPDTDYTAVLQVSGLPPSSEWYYGVEVEGELRTQVLPLSTAPPAGAQGVTKLAFGSCSKDEDQPIFAAIDQLDPDLFLFIGDNHYANSSDLDGLRWHYRWSLERPARAILADHTPTLATWDDHDYVGNNTDGTEPGRDTALRAFTEYWAHRSYGADGLAGVFHRYDHGDVELFMVDDRYWRGEDDSMLGDAQAAWLLDALEQSTATFKLVACGSQWTLNGSSDSWASFPEARAALFDGIRDRGVEGVVLLSGDIHRSEFIRMSHADMYPLYELTSSPLATFTTNCPDEGQLECFPDLSFMLLEIDTLATDPTLTATLRDVDGGVVSELEIRRSELGI